MNNKTARFLLDTNIVSEPLRPRPKRTILTHLAQHQHHLAISAPVWHELWFGCQRLPASTRRSAIERYLQDVVAASMPILPYDDRAATWQASQRARLTNQGLTPPFVDSQIAAIAWANNLTLVTLNRADYDHFSDLTVVDWC
ncbi:MAG TPA: type II toxin-antitoxin system VapC family toxin [Anaerolineae bacterium]|nr:type II toxin-antitoxin system VapC family toxin [Anaerolineae bacterium]